MQIKPDQELVYEKMYRRLQQDHLNCTFHGTYGGAPGIYERYEISADGKYRFIQSNASLTMMEKNTAVERWYNNAQQVNFMGFEDNGNRLNRYWTRYTFPLVKMPTSLMNWVILPPMLSKPGFYSNMAQIDIKSAYFSVLNIVGLYPTVDFGHSFGVGRRLDGYPFADNKTVRNSLYGMCFNPKLTYITRAQGKTVVPKIPVSNPHLMQVVQCIFHGIAREARERGAVQWYTDGGIIPADKAWGFMAWIASNYGLSVRLKCIGTAEVFTPSQYITPIHKPRKDPIVERRTDTIEGFKHDYPLGLYEGWLREKLAPWIRKRADPQLLDERK